MSIDQVDKKRKTLSIVVPRSEKKGNRKVSRSSYPSSSAKADSHKNQQLVEKVKDLEFFREDRINAVKHKIFSRSYESSSILDTLADELIKVLR